MSTSTDDEKVLVMFPAAKNYPKATMSEQDSIAKALQEIELVEEKLRATTESKELKKELHEEVKTPQHVVTHSGSRPSVRMSIDELIDVLDSQMSLLEENSKRMKYYLDEIDFFWPESND